MLWKLYVSQDSEVDFMTIGLLKMAVVQRDFFIAPNRKEVVSDFDDDSGQENEQNKD